MAWIKRNLFFVISIVVALGLTGYCGYLLYSSLQANSEVGTDYESKFNDLKTMLEKPVTPSQENIKAAKEDQARVQAFLADFRKSFAAFPPPPHEDDKGFNNFLKDSLVRFRAEATNAGVELPPEYMFSFSSLLPRLNYPASSIPAWMQQLEEMHAILDILFTAKINALVSLCRVPVSADDAGNADCLLQTTSVTNVWGIVTPYKITFRGFSTELAAVMEGFARSSNCFIIKTIDIGPDKTALPAASSIAPTPMAAPTYVAQPTYVSRAPRPTPFDRYERGGAPPMRPMPAPAPVPYIPAPVAPSAAAPIVVLSETPLLITMAVDVVKLKSSEPDVVKPKVAVAGQPAARP